MACRLASLALAFALTACATKPAEAPTIVLDPVVVTAEPFRGAWKNPVWDKVLISAIEAEGLLALRPADAAAFNLKPESAAAWARALVEVARFESGFVPSKRYTENFRDSKGQLIVSSGLFQISLESSRGYDGGPPKYSPHRIHDRKQMPRRPRQSDGTHAFAGRNDVCQRRYFGPRGRRFKRACAG